MDKQGRIMRMAKTTNHALRNRVPRGWLHIHLLMRFTIKEGILHIKLRDRPCTNRGHSKKTSIVANWPCEP
jgi:hypothetical protein